MLAELTGTHARSLYRVLRAATTLGILEENERRGFRLTPLGTLLRSDVEGSVRQLAVMFGEPWHWQSWGNLLHSVRTGEPAFEHTWGMGTYQFVTEHPEAAEVYEFVRERFVAAGHPEVASLVGHSIGVWWHQEEPMLIPNERRTLERGMIVCLEPILDGFWHVQDELLITDSGCELLSDGFETDELFQLAV